MTPIIENQDDTRTVIEHRRYLPTHLEPATLDGKYVGPAASAAAIAAAIAAAVAPKLDSATAATTYNPSFAASSSIVYDGSGNVTSATEGGITTTFTYNTDNTVNTETRLGKVRTWVYDGTGNPTSSTVV